MCKTVINGHNDIKWSKMVQNGKNSKKNKGFKKMVTNGQNGLKSAKDKVKRPEGTPARSRT